MTSLIFHPNYHAEIGKHVMQIRKYQKVFDRLNELGIKKEIFCEPIKATFDELALIHSTEYINEFLSAKHTSKTISSELPLNSQIADFFLYATGGTILAAKEALKNKYAINLNGGFHHAFRNKAEGFCYINDIAVAIAVLQNENKIDRALVIDCDLHQGNGTARIFRKDERVFTFSIHQQNIYPIKEKSDLDIGLYDLVGDDDYLIHLKDNIEKILKTHCPELVIYQAGADPFSGDQLGSLKITKKGLKKRDDLILEKCKELSIPIAGTLGGGYAANPADTVDIHLQTSLSFINA
ncbi:MAG: histone deacetylase [Nitrospinota bacterium]|nr:histone deacetylase [Nitrospinota bacterium]